MRNKRATIKDVAALAETSVSVVSYVLNNKPGISISDSTKERIFAAAAKLNYVPNSAARALRKGSENTIAFFAFWNTEDSSYNKFLSGLTHAATKKGYSITLCDNAALKKEKLIALHNQLNFGSVIVLLSGNPYIDDNKIKEADILSALKAINIPALVINGEEDISKHGLDALHFGFFETAFFATEYLINEGCKKIAYLKDDLALTFEKERLKGFYAAMSKYGLSEHSVITTNDIEKLLCGDLPDGVVCNKSDTGYLFLKAAKENKVNVPKSIKVIAANNESFAEYLEPSLTTVALPLREFGKMAAYKIINKVENKNYALPQLEYKVIVRESV